MRCGFKLNFLILGAVLGLLFTGPTLQAENIPIISYSEINLTSPKDSVPIQVYVSQDQSDSFRWKAGQRLKVSLFVESSAGNFEQIRDANGGSSWSMTLDPSREGRISITPSSKTFTGKLVVKVDGKLIELPGGDSTLVEKIYEYTFHDSVKIKVHFTDQMLEQSGESDYFAKNVLDAAVQAYQTITQFEGFSTVGYSFASPDPSYAYDPDRTIDVYLGNPSYDTTSLNHGFTNLSFKDAPCFDTLKISDTQYQAVILLPSNYKEFIKNWERINPSSLGTRNVNVDLRGTLIHEMLHVIIFYYNKNLNKDASTKEVVSTQDPKNIGKKVDWYVEGLARYFETFSGARHDFFSQGFKQTLPDKIRFSRGGSNYFMRYPDQAFTDLRYENALFWRFIDYRYGMASIERLSREFRDYSNYGFESALEKATQTPFKELLKTFAMSILLKDFGLKDDSVYLKDIAKTAIVYRKEGFSLVGGNGEEKFLGRVCDTDWIGRWGSESARLNEPPVAGDNTEKSDVSGWATDYFEMKLDASDPSLPTLGINHKQGGLPVAIQLVLVTKGGSLLTKDLGDISSGNSGQINLKEWVGHEGLSARDIDKIYILITNTDPSVVADYEVTDDP